MHSTKTSTASLPNDIGNELISGSKSDTEVGDMVSRESKDLSDVNDNYNGEKEDITSGLTLPRLRDSITPWRNSEKPAVTMKPRRGRSNTSLEVSSPINSRPATRNSLFSVDGAYTITSSSASSEVDSLHKQLTTYKLKVRALLELIKQFNYGGEGLENNESFYQKLISTITQDDDVEELKSQIRNLQAGSDAKSKTIVKLEEQLIDLDKQLMHTKQEYTETLEYANEYIVLNDKITTCIDEMLGLLLENVELSAGEKSNLEEAKKTSSEFLVAKMNALTVALEKTVHNSKAKSKCEETSVLSVAPAENIDVVANSTGVDPRDLEVFEKTNVSRNDSAMDTRFELAVEGMHEQYENFVKSIQRKLERSADLENALSTKLVQQSNILQMMNSQNRNNDTEEEDNSQYHNSPPTSVDDFGRHASIDLSTPYKEHLESLNSLVQTLKATVADKTHELEDMKERIQDQERLRKSEQRSKDDLQTLKEISKQKENTWEEFIGDLEQSIEHFQTEKETLLKENDELKRNVELLKNDNHKLKDAVHNAVRKSEVYNEQRSRLTHELKTMTDELVDLKDENSALHKLAFNVEAISNTVHKQNSEFQKFQGHLLLHLDNVFKTLSKILQKKSIDQSKRKLQALYKSNGISDAKIMQPKLESLYNFIETALESIVESYMAVILTEKDKVYLEKGHEKEMQLRIDELERKWVSERERRKLDSNAAEIQISKLESENEALREKLYNMTIR
ncbi:uncharacterized protein ZBAI_04957 [Zygosaccharomyces bailii ISA1307]|nr:uncharacterized protein ZBAI_04957 [Zygosaccharomyces bailii ISA1307]